ncbi:MAG: AAA family ATPase [Actinomycetia bacterium]|nr:AAA family ATPase [Actinomycetes bacterium]
MSSIVLATSSAAFEQKVRRAFGNEVNGSLQRRHSEGMFEDSPMAAKILVAEGPDVISIGPNVPVDLALDITREIEVERPEIGVILIAEPSPDLWERALHAGARDVLDPTATDEQIRTAFTRIIETADRRRRNLAVDAGVPDSVGRVITVVSPKGGVGKTTLATNVAVAIAANSVGRVALVDLDLQFGDVGNSLGLDPENTIADLAKIPGGVTATSLKVFMTRRDENLYALCAPMSPAEEVPEAIVARTIRILADDFEQVIVDTSAGLSEATLSAIDLSTDLVFLCDLSASALRGLRKVIDVLEDLGVSGANRYFVLNRADSRAGISVADAAAIVGMNVDVEIPASEAVARAMNFGHPVVEESPRSTASIGFESVAELFVDTGIQRKRRFSFGRDR